MNKANKTPGELQTDHEQGQIDTCTTVQQEHKSAAKTGTVSKSCSSTQSKQEYLDPS